MNVLHYLKWMRKRDGGVVNCVLQLAPLQALHGSRVALLTADASDVPRDASWRTTTDVSRAFEAGTPAWIEVSLRDRLAELRGSSAAQSERDTVSQLLTQAGLATARTVIAQSDIVHIHGPWSSSNAQVAAISRSLKKPYVVSAHGMLDDWSMAQGAWKKRLHLRLVSGPMLRGATCVHCAAEGEALQVAANTAARTRVVLLPMDMTPFKSLPGPQAARSRFNLRADVPTLLFLSRLHPKKGAEHAIDMLGCLRDRGIDCDLVLAGPEQDPAYVAMLKDRISRLSLAPHARLVGMVDGPDKLSLYQAASIMVLPTSQENFGFVILEAMACGTSVITTRGADLWPQLEASGGAMIAERTGDSLALAAASILSSPTRQAAMGRTGRDWAMKELEPSTLVGAYKAMYRDVPN